MGHHALGLGDRDLALGPVALKGLADRAKFPFLNANVVNTETREPLFQTSAILEAGDYKIGVTSVVTNAYRMKANQEKAFGFTVKSPQAVLGPILEEFEAKGIQIILLLGHLTLEECEDVAKEFPQIDVVLGSHSQKMKRYPESAGETFITDPYMKGKYLGIMTLFIDPEEGEFIFGDPGRKAAIEAEIRELEVRIQAREKAIQGAAQAKGATRNTTWLTKNLEDTRAQLLKAEAKLKSMGEDTPPRKSFMAYDYPAMGKMLADDLRIQKKVEKFKKRFPKFAKASK